MIVKRRGKIPPCKVGKGDQTASLAKGGARSPNILVASFEMAQLQELLKEAKEKQASKKPTRSNFKTRLLERPRL